MKKLSYLFIMSIFFFGANSCKKKGCTDSNAANFNSEAKKDDGTCVYTPIITLIGTSDTTISVATEWTDPGASAANIDGATVAVQESSTVDAGEVGMYTITYTATNNNGTTTVIRNVNVEINQDSYLGSWSVSDNCGGGTGLALNTAPTIIEGGNGNQILITDFFSGITGSYGTAICQIEGNQITIASASDGAPGGIGDINYSGFGEMNSNGLSFAITFTYQNTTPLTGSSGTCTATYSK